MKYETETLFNLLFGKEKYRRYTQNSPILPQVWIQFFEKKKYERIDLLFTPHRESSPKKLYDCILEELGNYNEIKRSNTLPLIYNETHLVGEFNLLELLNSALPLTKWWNKLCFTDGKADEPKTIKLKDYYKKNTIDKKIEENVKENIKENIKWLLRIVGYYFNENSKNEKDLDEAKLIDIGFNKLKNLNFIKRDLDPLYTVSLNRTVRTSLYVSTKTVKADAAHKIGNLKCENIRWAVIDSGVDAKHLAFEVEKTDNSNKDKFNSRIIETYDFTRLRINPDFNGSADELEKVRINAADRRNIKNLRAGLQSGRILDWNQLLPLIKVEHDDDYKIPVNEHGTHVAGILGANLSEQKARQLGLKEELSGMCPDIKIYDLRVIDDEGNGNEFNLLAALQFVRYLNQSKDQPIIHGVNLSLSLEHDVKTSACGRSPVCEECERLVGNGVVVVAAAGNLGYSDKSTASIFNISNYQGMTITDPGNAENIITVGSTHKEMPHTYGVSYFSSRGPTGDGRAKPDIIAPGEKIESTIPNNQTKIMDGTSMAAPHVSGAAALLLARHVELIGQPMKVKEVLCQTATDLGREHHFQGHGLVDILRAIQSI